MNKIKRLLDDICPYCGVTDVRDSCWGLGTYILNGFYDQAAAYGIWNLEMQEIIEPPNNYQEPEG